jgi:hypothetical protein
MRQVSVLGSCGAFPDGNTYMDAATPQYWPYQEKVLGWAAWPIVN